MEGSGPNETGEQGMHCPLHEDNTRSASVNWNKGVFFCQVCQYRGITIDQLSDYVEGHPDLRPPTSSGRSSRKASNGAGFVAPISEGQVAGYHAALLANSQRLSSFLARRGLDRDTVVAFQLGWDQRAQAYTIPVRDFDGELVNIRFYQLDPTDDRRKIWSIPGRGSPVLYPAMRPGFGSGIPEWVVICEGELDALIAIQHGFPAITRTGGAGTWKGEWNGHFAGKVVYLCHDADREGENANRDVAAHLEGVALEVHVVHLPYSVTESHGKDVTDFFMEGNQASDFYQLLFNSEPWGDLAESEEYHFDLREVTLLESFDAANLGQRLRTRVTITGKNNPPYLLPEKVEYRCDIGAGLKCVACPMNAEGHNGSTSLLLERDNPLILKFLGSSEDTIDKLLRAQVTPVKCGRLQVINAGAMAVEELFVRPSVEHYRLNDQAGDYIARKVVSVGKHDTMPNNTVEVVGTIFPSPRTQHNEFQAWKVERTETSVDRFELTDEAIELMKKFRPGRLQSPLRKLSEISKDLSEHVTKIYGRDTMHALMDLTFHSVVAYTFDGKLEPRGWLDTLIVGDTRTGKTEAAKRLIAFFAAGEYISCEAATFAGVVGGLQQYGTKEWTVTWGAVPINDRRLVVLDEASGLTVEQIAQMSSIRSSGEAQLTKIQSERTFARTRLLWLGNPRDGRTLGSYTYGAQAIRPLIGNNEDIARFDLAMSVAATEVSSEEINRTHRESRQTYDEQACRTMLHWAWSRKAEHIVWDKGTVDAVYKGAVEMGQRYVEDPPLVQAANIRMKISRVAVALATRLFSTPGNEHEKVLVRREHVRDAISFMDHLYNMPGFGYGERSKQEISDRREAAKNRPAVQKYLRTRPGLSRFIASMGGQFRRSDMEDMLNYVREEANQVVNTLWNLKMVTRKGVEVIVSPELHDIVREMEGH